MHGYVYIDSVKTIIKISSHGVKMAGTWISSTLDKVSRRVLGFLNVSPQFCVRKSSSKHTSIWTVMPLSIIINCQWKRITTSTIEVSPSESYTRRLHCVCVCVCLLELTTYHKFQMSTHKYFMRIKCPWPCALFSSAKNEIKGLLPDRSVGIGQEWRQLKSKHVQMAELIDGVRSKGHTRTVFIHHIDLAYDLSVKLIPCLYSCPAVVVSELRGYPVRWYVWQSRYEFP